MDIQQNNPKQFINLNNCKPAPFLNKIEDIINRIYIEITLGEYYVCQQFILKNNILTCQVLTKKYGIIIYPNTRFFKGYNKLFMLNSRSIKRIGVSRTYIIFKIPKKYSEILYFYKLENYYILGYNSKNSNHIVIFDYGMHIKSRLKTNSYLTCLCSKNILQFNNFEYNMKTNKKYKYKYISFACPHILSKNIITKSSLSKNLSNKKSGKKENLFTSQPV